MISGFETPSVDAQFTWPPELKDEIFASCRITTTGRTGGGMPWAAASNFGTTWNTSLIAFEQGARLTRYCGDKFGWDVLMTVFKLVDNLQHKAWKYLDPRTSGRYPREAELAARCFTRLDDVLGDVFDYAQGHGATIVIMSDHGHGSLDGKAQPNLLLARWGYLGLRSSWEQARTRAGHWWHRFTKGRATRFEQGSRGIERDLAVDWSRTRACVMHAGIYGYLYINLKGRDRWGSWSRGIMTRCATSWQHGSAPRRSAIRTGTRRRSSSKYTGRKSCMVAVAKRIPTSRI